jgi:hypothetical protein
MMRSILSACLHEAWLTIRNRWGCFGSAWWSFRVRGHVNVHDASISGDTVEVCEV